MTWFAINYYPLNVLPGLLRMWSFGHVWACEAAWGSFGAVAFQRPLCHLLDQRPDSWCQADVAAGRGDKSLSRIQVFTAVLPIMISER